MLYGSLTPSAFLIQVFETVASAGMIRFRYTSGVSQAGTSEGSNSLIARLCATIVEDRFATNSGR
jgi:hypothetical protein